MAPNLLAHHLGILERAGLVRRVVSEGDRRRSYVQVVADAVDQIALAPARIEAARVLFICTRNSARSILAAALWDRVSAVPASSAGTVPAPRVHPMAHAAARRAGFDLGDACPRHVGDVARTGDLVVSTCDGAHESLVGGMPPAIHWSIADPVRVGTGAAFDRALADLSGRVVVLAAVVVQVP